MPGFLIAVWHEGKETAWEVQGERVTGDVPEDARLFVHRPHCDAHAKETEWVASEEFSGRLIGTGPTKQQAVADALASIKRYGGVAAFLERVHSIRPVAALPLKDEIPLEKKDA